jgi:hypothetical protein
MQIDLARSEFERTASRSEGHCPHAEYVSVELNCLVDVGHRENKVVKMIHSHRLTLAPLVDHLDVVLSTQHGQHERGDSQCEKEQGAGQAAVCVRAQVDEARPHEKQHETDCRSYPDGGDSEKAEQQPGGAGELKAGPQRDRRLWQPDVAESGHERLNAGDGCDGRGCVDRDGDAGDDDGDYGDDVRLLELGSRMLPPRRRGSPVECEAVASSHDADDVCGFDHSEAAEAQQTRTADQLDDRLHPRTREALPGEA